MPVMLAVVAALVVTSQAVRAAPALTMTLTANPSPVHSGQTLTYTIKATNSGGSTLTNVSLADTVNSLGGSSYTITKSLGSCAQQGAQVTCSASSLGTGQSWTVTIAGPVTAAAGTTLNNTASASGSQSGQTAIAGSSVATLVDLPQGFTQTVVAQMHNPTVIAWAPNGDMWVGEQAGQIRVVHNGTLQTNPVITLQADGTSERGLLGLVFDPGFSSNNGGNGFIYVSYTTSADVTQVSRFTVVNGSASLGSEKILLKGNQVQNTFGPGNTLKLGPDGKLWWSVGGNPYPWDNAQSLATIYGKIHRINLDGTVPADNPFVNVPHALPSIYAYGLRNPFRFTFLPNNNVMAQDTGSSYWEELNYINPGSNYGWDLAEGNCFSCGYVNPVFAYGHLPNDGATSAILAYNGSTFPSSYKNVVFFGDYNRRDIEAVTFDPTYHTPVSDYVFNANAGTISDLEQGPDGNLYFTSIFESKVQKISATGPFAPTAVASATPNSGAVANVPVQFSSNGSTDAFGNTGTLSYSWNFGDGSSSTSANPQHAYASNGSYVATLTVTASGKSTSASATVMVGRTTTASISAPATYNGGDTINFSGSAIDSVDGALPAGAYTWQADFISNGVAEPFYLHENPHPFFGPKSGVTSGSFTIPTDVSNSGGTLYRITLTVVNSAGVATVVTQDINPNPASWTVNTNSCQGGSTVPLSGAAYVTDGAWQTATNPTTDVPGVQHVFMGAPDQVIGGQPYRFLGWNGCSGGALVNAFANPAGPTTYNANYEAVQAAPSPWHSTDVGTPMPGSTDYGSGSQSFYLDGSGADASGSTDQFHYTYQTLNGNGSIVARVRYQTTPNPGVKAGVMIKSSPTAGSAFVSALVTPDVSQNTPNLNGINCVFPSNAVGAGCDAPLPASVPSVGQGVMMQYSGGSKSVTSASALANFKSPNKWLKLQRSGNTFTASYSSDGSNWTQISSTNVSMGNSVTIGMFVTAKDVREYSTAAFDSVSLNGSGGPTNDFSISATPSTVTVAPGGSGPTTINTAITSGSSQNVALSASGLPPGAGASFNPSSVTSGGSSTMTITTMNSTPTGTYTVTVTGTGTSATHSTPVTLSVQSLPPPSCPTSWNCADIGNPSPAGSEALSGGTWTIQGGGSDIQSTADQFHFDWQTLASDGSISAHVATQSNTNAWAKTGVMLRSSSSAGSAYYALLVTPGNGIVVSYRSTQGGSTVVQHSIPGGTVPVYLRVARSGTQFAAYTSPDNSTWTLVPNSTQVLGNISGAILEGLAVTSHANGTLCTVTMDSVATS